MYYQTKIAQVSLRCYYYRGVVVGGGYSDGGVAALEFADENVVFQ